MTSRPGAGGGPKRIFVGALPKTLGEDAFREYFAKFGELTDIELMRRPGDSRNRGFGFIKYATGELSEKVINMPHVLSGQTLTVNYAKVPLPRDTRRFYIGSINKDLISEADLKTHFERYGKVEDCVIMKEKNFGFIAVYNSDHSRLDAILNDTHMICGEKLKPEAAKPKPTRRPPIRSMRDGPPGGGGPYGGSRFGGPQRYNPYDSPHGPPRGGPWGGPQHMPYPPYYPEGPPPPMRNPEYETYEIKPSPWKTGGNRGAPGGNRGAPGGNRGAPGGNRGAPGGFQGPSSEYNPQRDASSSSYNKPSFNYNSQNPGGNGPAGGHGGPPGGPPSYNPYDSGSGAAHNNSHNPNSHNPNPMYNQPNAMATYNPQSEAPPHNHHNYPTSQPTNYPNTQQHQQAQANYPPYGQGPPSGQQQQNTQTYGQNTFTTYNAPPANPQAPTY